MADIRKGIELVQGREPSPEQIAKIQQVAHSFDIPQNDPLFPFVVFMDVSTGVFTELPGRIVKATNKAANNAAETAAAQATEQVSRAVADLIPTITQATAAQMAKAVRQNNANRSFLGIGIAALVLAAAFGLGWMNGAGLFAALQVKTLTTAQFWDHLTPALIAGVIMSLLVTFGGWLIYMDLDEDDLSGRFWVGLATIAAAVATGFFML